MFTINTNIPCLQTLFKALYVLSGLFDKKGISIDDAKILGANTISLPIK